MIIFAVFIFYLRYVSYFEYTPQTLSVNHPECAQIKLCCAIADQGRGYAVQVKDNAPRPPLLYYECSQLADCGVVSELTSEA